MNASHSHRQTGSRLFVCLWLHVFRKPSVCLFVCLFVCLWLHVYGAAGTWNHKQPKNPMHLLPLSRTPHRAEFARSIAAPAKADSTRRTGHLSSMERPLAGSLPPAVAVIRRGRASRTRLVSRSGFEPATLWFRSSSLFNVAANDEQEGLTWGVTWTAALHVPGLHPTNE